MIDKAHAYDAILARSGSIPEVAVFLPAGPDVAGNPLPAVVNLLDADGTASPVRAATLAEEGRQHLDTR